MKKQKTLSTILRIVGSVAILAMLAFGVAACNNDDGGDPPPEVKANEKLGNNATLEDAIAKLEAIIKDDKTPASTKTAAEELLDDLKGMDAASYAEEKTDIIKSINDLVDKVKAAYDGDEEEEEDPNGETPIKPGTGSDFFVEFEGGTAIKLLNVSTVEYKGDNAIECPYGKSIADKFGGEWELASAVDISAYTGVDVYIGHSAEADGALMGTVAGMYIRPSKAGEKASFGKDWDASNNYKFGKSGPPVSIIFASDFKNYTGGTFDGVKDGITKIQFDTDALKGNDVKTGTMYIYAIKFKK